MYSVDNRNMWINNHHIHYPCTRYNIKRKKLKKVIKDMVFVSTLRFIVNSLLVILWLVTVYKRKLFMSSRFLTYIFTPKYLSFNITFNQVILISNNLLRNLFLIIWLISHYCTANRICKDWIPIDLIIFQ